MAFFPLPRVPACFRSVLTHRGPRPILLFLSPPRISCASVCALSGRGPSCICEGPHLACTLRSSNVWNWRIHGPDGRPDFPRALCSAHEHRSGCGRRSTGTATAATADHERCDRNDHRGTTTARRTRHEHRDCCGRRNPSAAITAATRPPQPQPAPQHDHRNRHGRCSTTTATTATAAARPPRPLRPSQLDHRDCSLRRCTTAATAAAAAAQHRDRCDHRNTSAATHATATYVRCNSCEFRCPGRGSADGSIPLVDLFPFRAPYLIN